jgi:hypothetical protein
MRRRGFIAALGGAAAWPIAARAQKQTDKVWRVGYLSPLSATNFSVALFDAFRLKLNDLGYVEGRNLRLCWLSVFAVTTPRVSASVSIAHRMIHATSAVLPGPCPDAIAICKALCGERPSQVFLDVSGEKSAIVGPGTGAGGRWATQPTSFAGASRAEREAPGPLRAARSTPSCPTCTC